MKDWERDILRRTILEILAKACVHYTDLDKKVCATCHSFATTNTFKSQLHYLLNNDYIIRIARGIYQITERDKKYLALLVLARAPCQLICNNKFYNCSTSTARG